MGKLYPIELRFGNSLIDKPTGDIVTFVCLDVDAPLDRCYIKYLESTSEWDRGWSFADAQPIELSHETILRIGFVQDKDSSYIKEIGVGDNKFQMRIWNISKALWRWSVNSFVNVDLQYIHQLQNLHYSLTGEELIWDNKLKINHD